MKMAGSNPGHFFSCRAFISTRRPGEGRDDVEGLIFIRLKLEDVRTVSNR
jgi:hypothetical protein